MEHYGYVAPTTVSDIFGDFLGRRSGLLQALTKDADSLCYLCHPGIKNGMCLYGHPDGKWEVSYPPKMNENQLPQPLRGINLKNNGTMRRQDWLAFVAAHSDSWLISLSFYFAAHLTREQRNRLFHQITILPTLSEELIGSEIVVYKVGDCIQKQLLKLWKEYETSSQPESNGPTLEVGIPPEHVTATNTQLKRLWGTDVYTDDSDLVAVLIHTGYIRSTASTPPPTMQALRTTIRVLPPQDYYTSKSRNNVRSRAWGARPGCSYSVERCYILKKEGGTIELKPSLTHSEPTLAPMAVQQATMIFNLCNEAWLKYSMSLVADKGMEKPLLTSARLKNGEVLYLETHSCRYELCFAGDKTRKAILASQQDAMDTDSDESLIPVFRWSRCKKPLPEELMRSIGFPLPLEHIEVLEENLDWEDVEWSQTGVWIAGKEYTLARVFFLSPK